MRFLPNKSVDKIEIEKIDTPYVLLIHNHYDFEMKDANLERMIKVAENQNADIVTGSLRDDDGKWENRK